MAFLKPIYFPEPVIAVQGKLTRIQFVSQCNMLLIMKNRFALDAILQEFAIGVDKNFAKADYHFVMGKLGAKILAGQGIQTIELN